MTISPLIRAAGIPLALLLFAHGELSNARGQDTPPADAPFGAEAAEAAPEETPPRVYSTEVATILADEQTTPGEKLKAALMLAKLDEPELAQQFVAEIVEQNLDQAALAELAEEVGTSVLLQIGQNDAISEAGRQLVADAQQARYEILNDPQRIADLIHNLGGDKVTRRAAIRGLLESSQTAAGALVPQLVAEDAQIALTARSLLKRMWPESVGPLQAALQSEDPKLRAASAELLAKIGGREAVPFLLPLAAGDSSNQVRQRVVAALEPIVSPLPTQQETISILRQQVDIRLRSTPTGENEAEIWNWDETEQRPVSRMGNPIEKQLAEAFLLTSELGDLAPARGEFALWRMALGAELELERWSGEIVPESSTLSDALDWALTRRLDNAAVALAEALAQAGDARILLDAAPRYAPLVSALRSPAEDVRWAALSAVMQLAPDFAYPGSSEVDRALLYFSASGSRRAVVASPALHHASNIASRLRTMGYDAIPVATGKAALRQVLAAGGADLLLLDSAITQPALPEILGKLQANPTTSELPVGLFISSSSRPLRAKDEWRDPRRTRLNAHSKAIGRASSEEIAAWLERLPDHDSPNAATGRAQQAMRWIGQVQQEGLAVPSDTLFESVEVLTSNLYHPELSEAAGIALAEIGSRSSQRALARAASNRALSVDLRVQHGKSFASNLAKFGNLLTSHEIRQQYDLYNASESADRETQQILGSLLDAIESVTPGADPS